MVIVPWQPLGDATVFGQYLGHEYPSYRNRSLGPIFNCPARFDLVAILHFDCEYRYRASSGVDVECRGDWSQSLESIKF